jgi:hypothetical protein
VGLKYQMLLSAEVSQCRRAFNGVEGHDGAVVGNGDQQGSSVGWAGMGHDPKRLGWAQISKKNIDRRLMLLYSSSHDARKHSCVTADLSVPEARRFNSRLQTRRTR